MLRRPRFPITGNNSSVEIHARYMFCRFLVRMRSNIISSASGLKIATMIAFRFIISYKGNTILASFGYIFTVHAQKQLFKRFPSKIWPHDSLELPRFPIRQMYFHYWDHVTLTSDLLSLTVLHVHTSHARPTYQIWLYYDCRLLSYELLNLITYGEQPLRMLCVTWSIPRGGMVHIFEIQNPNSFFDFVTLRALRRR